MNVTTKLIILMLVISGSYACNGVSGETRHCAFLIQKKLSQGFKKYNDSWTSAGGLSELSDMYKNIKASRCRRGTDPKLLSIKFELAVTGKRWIDNTTSTEFAVAKGIVSGYFGGPVGLITNLVHLSESSDNSKTLKDLHSLSLKKFGTYIKKHSLAKSK